MGGRLPTGSTADSADDPDVTGPRTRADCHVWTSSQKADHPKLIPKVNVDRLWTLDEMDFPPQKKKIWTSPDIRREPKDTPDINGW